ADKTRPRGGFIVAAGFIELSALTAFARRKLCRQSAHCCRHASRGADRIGGRRAAPVQHTCTTGRDCHSKLFSARSTANIRCKNQRSICWHTSQIGFVEGNGDLAVCG